MAHTSFIEISESALKKNFRFLRKELGKNVRISSVVKGNAYGHDIATIVPLIEKCGVMHFSVFSSFEARQVKAVCKDSTSIMIMGYIDPADMDWVIENEIEFFVYDLRLLSVSAKTAASVGKPAHIHLEVETGLHRTGFSRPCLSKAVTFIKRQSGLFVLEGVCSHFAGAESIQNYWRIKNQMKHFKLMEAYIRQRGLKPRYRHLACSAAAMGYPQSRLDMVRIGIMQYGLWPSNETWIYFSAQKKLKVSPLKRVIGWKSTIMTINEVARGEYIGYGTSFMAPTPMKIAIVPVGYSQGYTRSLSFKGKVLIRGRFANIAGLINMNSLMIDVTRIPNAAPGDEVVLIGHQGRHSITIASFNEDSNQLNNELLTRLPMDIPRKVVR